MTKAALIFLGGGMGAVARYAVQEWAARKWGGHFPVGTLAVNISGAFFIGVLMTLFVSRLSVPESLRWMLITGVLGGYTTFSALAWETLQLGAQNGWGLSILYAAGSVVGGLVAAVAGVILVRSF